MIPSHVSAPGIWCRMLFPWWFILVTCSQPVQTLAQQDPHCDPYLPRPPENPLGYRLRGDRCEGIYFQELSSAALAVVSFTEFFTDFDVSSPKDLRVEWMSPGNETVRLRAVSLRPRLYYRMDTHRPAGPTVYNWPTDILRALKLSKNEIAVVAWIQRPLGGTSRDLYVPLRVRQQGDSVRASSYQLTLLPGVQLDEVFISLAPVEADGRQSTFLISDKKLGRGYYPAGRSVRIPIEKPAQPGFYYLEIGAPLTSGGSSALRAWFYHSGP